MPISPGLPNVTKVPDGGWFPLVIDRETSEMIGAVRCATAGEVRRRGQRVISAAGPGRPAGGSG
jgi:hypothetical protein